MNRVLRSSVLFVALAIAPSGCNMGLPTLTSPARIPAGPTAKSNYSVLWSFGGKKRPNDGLQPEAALVADTHGNLYGTTFDGGTRSSGAIVELTPPKKPSGTYGEKVLWSFLGAHDGANPHGALILFKGKLYGTASTGGAHGYGTVFELDPADTSKINVLHSFAGDPDGETPMAGLVADPSSGMLYGTTEFGGDGENRGGNKCPISSGTFGCGTLFECDPSAGTCQVIWSFVGVGVSDGNFPVSSLIVAKGLSGASVSLVGTTSEGGNYSCQSLSLHCGTVFIAKLVSSGWTESAFYDFGETQYDGNSPQTGVVQIGNPSAQMFAGTTDFGGTAGYGTIFVVTATPKNEVVLHSFGGSKDNGDGANPLGGLLLNPKSGELYGTTSAGGSNGGGTAYKINPTSGAYTAFWNFTKNKGIYPQAGFIAGTGANNHSLYGTALGGGSGGHGVANIFHNEF